jgi:hypothetical protein
VDISLLGNNNWWEDTMAYIGIIRTLVERYVKLLENSTLRIENSTPEYLQNIMGEGSLEVAPPGSPGKDISLRAKLMDALHADILLNTVSKLDTSKPRHSVPSLVRNEIRQNIVIPKIFQRILQLSGLQKLPDFDHICAMFTVFLNPEKTNQLIRVKMGNFPELGSPESPPPKLSARNKRTSFSLTSSIDTPIAVTSDDEEDEESSDDEASSDHENADTL